VERVLYCCKFTCQDVENCGENEVCFLNHPIPWNIGMLSPFVMDDNKLFIYLLNCRYFKLRLLLKPLQIHSFLL
jgi:hypothetical protein